MGQLLSTFTIRTLERSKFQSRKGQADEVGEYSIDGVSGTRAKIQLDFFRPGEQRQGIYFLLELLSTMLLVYRLAVSMQQTPVLSCVLKMWG